MASGDTITGSLADSLDEIRASARTVREQVGVMTQLVDRETLGKGKGLSWLEITYDQLVAQAITETTELNNPQQISDSLLTITPTMIGMSIYLSDRVQLRISPKGYAKLGTLGGNAIARKKDADGITVLDAATTSLCGAGVTITTGHVAAASARITGNTTEPGSPPLNCVVHPFQNKDFYDELIAGVGTYILTPGQTARVFGEGFKLPIASCNVYMDGNIPIDGSGDAKGGVFAKMGIILVEGRADRVVAVRNEKRGGGGNEVYHYAEYAYGERSSGNWVYELYSDATAPTS